MSQDLILKDMGATLPATKPEYNLMLSNIKDKMPAVTRDTSNFHKSAYSFNKTHVGRDRPNTSSVARSVHKGA